MLKTAAKTDYAKDTDSSGFTNESEIDSTASAPNSQIIDRRRVSNIKVKQTEPL